MKATLTKIGNSKGVIIPAQVLKQCGFEDEVSLEVKEDSLVIMKVRKPREGWAQAFKAAGPTQSLIDDVRNTFDEEEWTW